MIFTILNAEVLDPDWTTKLFLNFDIDELFAQEMFLAKADMMLQPQVYDAGYETFNSILNVGGLYMMLLLLIAGMIISFILAIIIKYLFAIGCCKSVLMEGGEEAED